MNVLVKEQPLISIVVPSLNQGNFIEQTLASILGQQYTNLELIVIDGGSTDQTLEVLSRYEKFIHYWVSEPDNGQAHAINKGFRQANGSILAWLNSDDMYLPCTLSTVAQILGDSQEPKLIYGGCLYFFEQKTKAFNFFAPTFDAEQLTYEDYIAQSSTFWSRSLWEQVGELNETYHYVLDWDWFIRAAQICSFIPLDRCLSIYRSHDDHKTGTGGLKRAQEIVQIVETYADSHWSTAYQDVYKQLVQLRTGLTQLAKFRLYRFRPFFYPHLYFKHGKRIDIALSML